MQAFVHPLAEHAGSLPVDYPDPGKSRLCACPNIFLEQIGDLTGSKGVQVKPVLQGNLERFGKKGIGLAREFLSRGHHGF